MGSKKLTWKVIAKLVAKECGEDPETCERVVKGFATVTNFENDPECDLTNAFHRLSEAAS